MASSPASAAGITPPQDVAAKFPQYVALIMHSKSMNDDERAYWFSALPGMNAEQLATLLDILTTEKQQLETIDRKYNQDLSEIDRAKAAQEFAKRQEEQRAKRSERETKAEETEAETEAKILEDIRGQ